MSVGSKDAWFAHIKTLHEKRTDFSLDRVDQIAKHLQLKNFSCPVITITGTNGKGSTAKTLESIYFQAGFKTALYTSPHLLEFNERIRIHNKNISDENLLRAFSVIENARENIILSFFEFITLAALFLFQEASPNVIILEAGLGGRLDAVNIVESDVAVITSIGLDHINLLGDTREKIAYEKAHIARANKNFICGEENPPEIISKIIAEKKSILYQINRDFFYEIKDLAFHYRGKIFHYKNLPMPILKPQNIATAIAVIESLQNKLFISEKNIADGIQKTQWLGRFELIESPLPCVLDVAHNPSATEWLAKQYQQLPAAKTIAVVGMLKDKAMTDCIAPLLPFINNWYVCSLLSDSETRGADGEMIAAFLKSQGKECTLFASVADAMYSLQLAHCQKVCDRALIFGSFYTIAAAKRWFAEQVNQGEKPWKKKQNKDLLV
ncbi:MAG TPA: bifunctional tetrahydrofolate synthase/dihydrofolate synthase [Coxiellaceae bacterium]|nr:bifunctional tetrahydrofolate synthase/dihydrofolate synthase [Coxiellaceae bacterium]